MRELHARLRAITPDAELMRTLATRAVREQKLLAPRKTSNLGRSIHVESVTATTAQTVASADYAAHVEYGTRGGQTIVPKRARALRWAASGADARLSGSPRSGGNVRFAKRVIRGATRAQPYMVPGAQKAVEGIKDIVIESWNSAA